MANALDIASKTRRIDVDNRLSLRFYYRTASHLLKQASIYREEHNVIDLYILLLRFSSLVSETIPDHRDYRTAASKEKSEFTRKLRDVLSELERLKPEAQKQVDRLNKVHKLPPPSADASEWANFTSNWPSAPQQPVRIEQKENQDRLQIGSKEYFEPAVGSGSSSSSFSAVSSSSSSSAVSPLDNQFSGLSLNLPPPRDETLSRHSIFGPSVPHRQSAAVPFRAQYPSYIDASPIEMPSYQQRWGVPPQQHVVPNHTSSIQSSAEPVRWPEVDRHFPETYTPVIGPDLAPVPSLIRQPDPPPVRAHVQTLESLDYPSPQLPPESVADPRPGSAPTLAHDLGHEKGTKHLHISTRMMEEFLALSSFNTQQNLETCAILAGSLKNGVFYVNALIVPKQEATSDSCQTINEEEIFDVQDKRGLFQLGWIHTHPTQTCFMSSIDLHTHYSYQIMLNEAIAIVMAPTDTERDYGIFRLSDPGGIKSIQQCDKRGFHPHEQTEDGSPIYEHCGHVFMSPKLRFDVIDLRNS